MHYAMQIGGFAHSLLLLPLLSIDHQDLFPLPRDLFSSSFPPCFYFLFLCVICFSSKTFTFKALCFFPTR